MPKAIRIDQYRYMTNEAWRVLLAVEMGMKNHEFVPPDLVHKISRCTRRGSSFLKLLRDDLVPHGLLAYETDNHKGYSGYRLTNLGYDYLALHTLIKSGQVCDLGSIIGAGKEADVYLAVAGDMCGCSNDREEEQEATNEKEDSDLPSRGDYIVIKFHRLGRTSFRKVREKREYHQGRRTCSWLYLDRLAARREYEMMKILYEFGLPVPRPLANNRNCVVMSLLSDAIPLCKVFPTTLRANNGAIASCLYTQSLEILGTITRNGLVHGDFNEFNLLVSGLNGDSIPDFPSAEDDNSAAGNPIDLSKVKLILIDFPQMISREHRTAQEIYKRDLNGITSFFRRYLELNPEEIPPSSLLDIPRNGHMDVELRAPGYPKQRPTKKTGGRDRRADDSDLLVGNVAAIALEGSSDEGDDKSIQGDEEEESEGDCSGGDGEEESGNTSDSEVSDGEENVADSNADLSSATGRTNSRDSVNKKVTSQTIPAISLNEVRDRRRREEKRRIQNEIRLRIKRQQRASTKNKGRAEIATESRLFD